LLHYGAKEINDQVLGTLNNCRSLSILVFLLYVVLE